METNKNLNDLIINLKPKVIRFTGEKFPTELWNSGCQIKKKIRRYLPKNLIRYSKKGFSAFFLNNFLQLPEVLQIHFYLNST